MSNFSREFSSPFLSVDWWYSHGDIVFDRSENPEKINEKFANVKPNQKVFVKTDMLPQFYDHLIKIAVPFVLITASNDDHSVPYMHYPPQDSELQAKADAFLNSPFLICWFGKNVAIEHPKLRPYHLGPKWQWKTTQFFGESKVSHLAIYNRQCLQPKERMINRNNKPRLLYFNFNNTTNNPFYTPSKGCRQRIKTELMKRFPYCQSYPFVEYMDTLGTYKFCVSPPGRGITTHRTTEALMQGTIPIEEEVPSVAGLFDDLPVIIVKNKDWSIITPEYLLEKYEEIMAKIDTYNFDKLYCDYWLKCLVKTS